MNPRLKNSLRWGLGIFVSIPILAILVFFASIAKETWVELTLGPTLQQELGFRPGSPYVVVNGSTSEVRALDFVTPGGVFDRAGFKKWDIIVEDDSNAELYMRFNSSWGKPVTLQVVPGGDGLPVAQRKIRKITFKMPGKPTK